MHAWLFVKCSPNVDMAGQEGDERSTPEESQGDTNVGVVVIEARGLPPMESANETNPRVVVWADGQEARRTRVDEGALHPRYAQTEEEPDVWRFRASTGTDEAINVQVVHAPSSGTQEAEMGRAKISPPREEGTWKDIWVSLHGPEGRRPSRGSSSDNHGVNAGKVRLLLVRYGDDKPMPRIRRLRLEPTWLFVSFARGDVESLPHGKLHVRIAGRGPRNDEEKTLGEVQTLQGQFREWSPYSPPAWDLRSTNYITVTLSDEHGKQCSGHVAVPFLAHTDRENYSNAVEQVDEKPLTFDDALISATVRQ